MRIAICVPSRGGQMEVATGFDICAMTGYTLKNTKHELNFYTAMGTLIFDQRNSIVETAIKDRCDYVMFIDGDMRFPKDALTRLLKHNKDIVGVNATTRSEPVKPTAKNFKIEEDGKVSWFPIYSKEKKGIEIADGIGTPKSWGDLDSTGKRHDLCFDALIGEPTVERERVGGRDAPPGERRDTLPCDPLRKSDGEAASPEIERA